jgi:hypothetical protein
MRTPSKRDRHARGKKVQEVGLPSEVTAQRLGVVEGRSVEIVQACSVGVAPGLL